MGGKNLDLNGYSNDTEAGVYRQRAILWQKKMYKCCLQRRSVQESYCPQDDCNLLKTNISSNDSSIVPATSTSLNCGSSSGN